jgi:hypothetical protein
MSLVGFASKSFRDDQKSGNTQWNTSFRRVIDSIGFTSHDITSLLSLLSASISNGQPLPPYLVPPKAVCPTFD